MKIVTRHRKRLTPRRLVPRGLALSILIMAPLLALASAANALSFQIDFRASTYQVQGSDTYTSLLAQHQSETLLTSNSLNGLLDISAPVYAGGINRDYSLLMTTSVEVVTSGSYTFQVGTDWGRGGASVVIDNDTQTILDEFVTSNDLWWNNDWNDPDVFTTTVNMTTGSSYTLGWIGFENCCGGAATIRFSLDGAPLQVLDSTNGDAYFVNNPEPGTGLLLGFGLSLLAFHARRRHSPFY